MIVAVLALLASLNLEPLFGNAETWKMGSVDFVMDHSGVFAFADQKREIANCLAPGKTAWGSRELYESRVYFDADGVTRVEMSLYNRGDAARRGTDEMDRRECEALVAEISKALDAGGKTPAAEKKKVRGGGFHFTRRWTKPRAAELAWGVAGEKPTAKAEFVRLTLLRDGGAAKPKGAQKSVSGAAAKAKVRANVTKNDEGDVWIKNVPMVDQGRKGYCSAAVSERVLRYYGVAVDEHEIAQQAGSDAERGTSAAEMRETVKTVGSKYRLGYEEIVKMVSSIGDMEEAIERYNKAAKPLKEETLSISQFRRGNTFYPGEMQAAMKPKVLKQMRIRDARYKKFLAGVKKQVDAGVPVIWGVTLGIFPEPGVNPQSRGGHMRLIIGYNAKKREILYTDTWGAGHELKRMPEDWAFTVTNDAFFLKPL